MHIHSLYLSKNLLCARGLPGPSPCREPHAQSDGLAVSRAGVRKGLQYPQSAALAQCLEARAAQMLRPVGLDPWAVGMGASLSQALQLGVDASWASLRDKAR